MLTLRGTSLQHVYAVLRVITPCSHSASSSCSHCVVRCFLSFTLCYVSRFFTCHCSVLTLCHTLIFRVSRCFKFHAVLLVITPYSHCVTRCFQSFTLFQVLRCFTCHYTMLTCQYFSFRDRLFCMVPVQQLGEVSWSMVCAACCHMTLVFAIMHLYNIF